MEHGRDMRQRLGTPTSGWATIGGKSEGLFGDQFLLLMGLQATAGRLGAAHARHDSTCLATFRGKRGHVAGISALERGIGWKVARCPPHRRCLNQILASDMPGEFGACRGNSGYAGIEAYP
jgi:hypothetical protein